VLGSAFAFFVMNEEIFFKGWLVLALMLSRTATDFINKYRVFVAEGAEKPEVSA